MRKYCCRFFFYIIIYNFHTFHHLRDTKNIILYCLGIIYNFTVNLTYRHGAEAQACALGLIRDRMNEILSVFMSLLW